MPSPWVHGTRYRVRVPRSNGRWTAVSCGTADKRTAMAIGNMIDMLRDRAEFPVLDAIADGRKPLLLAYSEYRADSKLTETKAALDDADLSPLVSEWNGGGKPRYLAQVRRLIPADAPFPASRFRRRTISEHLAGLVDEQSAADEKPAASKSTRNRHRAALMQFGKWLVEREIVETNPVRDVSSQKENPGRMVIYAPKDVRRVVDALAAPYQALEAVLASTGIEMQAALRVRRRDIDLKARTLEAAGSKNEWRNRTVGITEDWALPIIRAHLKDLAPDALVFDGVSHDRALDAHHAAIAALGLPESRLHDQRHSYAVALRKRRVPDQIIAHQLGHKDSSLIAKLYGKYTPDITEIRRATRVAKRKRRKAASARRKTKK